MLSVKYFAMQIIFRQCENVLNLLSPPILFSLVRLVFKLFGVCPLHLQASDTTSLLKQTSKGQLQKSTSMKCKVNIYSKFLRSLGVEGMRNRIVKGRQKHRLQLLFSSVQGKNFNTRIKLGSALSPSCFIKWPLSYFFYFFQPST